MASVAKLQSRWPFTVEGGCGAMNLSPADGAPGRQTVRFMEFDRAEEIIDIGYRSAAEQLAHWTRTKTHE
ncbi:MAG: hypothetical protein WA147_07095 [Polaromonas sp.]